MSPDKTPWHQIFGAVQQEHLAAVNVQVETEIPLTTQPPRSDVLILQPSGQTGWTEIQRNYLPDGLRESTGQHNLLELKYTESVNQDVFDQVLGYHFFYRETRNLSRDQVKCFILSSHTTEKATREAFGYTRVSAPGVYHSDNILLAQVPLILLNELNDAPHNVFFKLFGSQQRAREMAVKGIKAWWIKQSSSRLFWLIHGLVKHWFNPEEVLMETVTVESLIEKGKSWQELALMLTPDDMLIELLRDTPLMHEIETKAIEKGIEKGFEQGIEKGIEQGIEKGFEQGIEKGIEQGIEKGRQAALLQTLRRILVLQFDISLMHFDKQLEGLSLIDLEQLSEAAFEAKSLAEFEATLARLVPPKPDR